MKNLLFLTLLLTFSYFALDAAQPLVELKDLPPDEKLEFYEESEELFVDKVLEYYNYVLAFKTQLDMLGVDTKIKFSSPTYEELTDLDLKVIKKYFAIAKALEKEVKQASGNFARNEIQELREETAKQKRKFDSLSLQEKKEYLAANSISFYKRRIENLLNENQRQNVVIDSLKYETYEQVNKTREKVKEYYEDYFKYSSPVVSISGSGNYFFFPDERIEEKVSFGMEAIFNLQPISKYGKYFDVWGAYWAPVFNANYDNPNLYRLPPNYSQTYKWNNHLYALGANISIPNILKLEDLAIGFKTGAGQFWGKGHMYNVNEEIADYSGQVLKFELNFGKPNVFAPIQIFASYSTYFLSDDLTFHSPNKWDIIDLNEPNISSFAIGVRYIVLKSSF